MALVLPQTNNGLHHKPLSLINPNHSNPSILSINLKHQSILCPPIQTAFRSRLRLFPVAKGLDKHSDQSNVQGGDDDDNIGVKAALSMLRFYKREISPLMPNSCRYVPTCSEYSMIAYKKYGVVKGSILTAWRLCRCNPVGNNTYASQLGQVESTSSAYIVEPSSSLSSENLFSRCFVAPQPWKAY